MMGWWNWDGGGWLGMIGMLLWLVVIVLLVVLLVRLFTGGARARSEPPARQTPEEILRERFARGEIDAEEYRQRSALLKE